ELLNHGAQLMLDSGGLSKGMQAKWQAVCRQGMQIIMQGSKEAGKVLCCACFIPAEVGEHALLGHLLQNGLSRLLTYRTFFQLLILVDQIMQLAQLVIQPGGG